MGNGKWEMGNFMLIAKCVRDYPTDRRDHIPAGQESKLIGGGGVLGAPYFEFTSRNGHTIRLIEAFIQTHFFEVMTQDERVVK